MGQWCNEWWNANAEPLIDAIATLEFSRIYKAIINVPHAYYEYIKTIYERSPEHVIVETFLICFILYITIVKKSYDPRKLKESKLNEKESEKLLSEWKPEPIVPKTNEIIHLDTYPLGIIEKNNGMYIKIKGYNNPLLNFATFDFLGLGSNNNIRNTAIQSLKKYGCGSCGPRGFYGTIDTHEILEKEIATFLNTPDSIVYSDIEATCSSVLPAFVKRGDLIIVDKGCCDTILVGANLARCTIIYYEHNNLKDLENKLEAIKISDKQNNRKSDCQRRYVVTEALFRNYGDIVNLPEILKLCEKYYFRLFLDESFSFGVLGKTGKGISEYFNLTSDDVLKKIEIRCASLSYSCASVGGFSTGSQEVVDYQRINSAGYVFSASAPPFTAAAATEALVLIRNNPALLKNLQENIAFLYESLKTKIVELNILNASCSPVFHLRLSDKVIISSGNKDINDYNKDKIIKNLHEQIEKKCFENGLAVVTCRYKKNQIFEPKSTIRMTVTAIHTKEDITNGVSILLKSIKNVLSDRNRTKEKK